MIDSIDEKRRFASLMVALADYYKQEISKGVMALYWEGLKQYDFEAIEKAAWAHTQSPDEAGRWMPKISDLKKNLEGSTLDQASIAWSKVDRAVRTIGPHVDVVFDDAIIHQVITDMGGWAWFGNQKEENWPFVANNFVNRYRGYANRQDQLDAPRLLIGISNTYNMKENHRSQEPRFIGNQAQAKQVWLQIKQREE